MTAFSALFVFADAARRERNGSRDLISLTRQFTNGDVQEAGGLVSPSKISLSLNLHEPESRRSQNRESPSRACSGVYCHPREPKWKSQLM